MLAYSERGRSIVLYSRDIVSTLTRARYPSFFREAAVGTALFNMPDTWSELQRKGQRRVRKGSGGFQNFVLFDQIRARAIIVGSRYTGE